ncbi:MAG: PKD domain-containing protein, partial [Bacteroidota bacterium]|nr:PKD domain-containing protein [Bacteroidota bacterium]
GDGKDTCIQYTNISTGPYYVYHSYTYAGNYEVCVKILYQEGCESKKCKIIQLGHDGCSIDFERIPVTTISGLSTTFRALPWHNDQKKPARICWAFGDGRDTCIQYAENYTGQYTVTHSYPRSDYFEVCVKVLYYGGCESYKCKRVFVGEVKDSCKVRLFEISPSITSLTKGFYVTTSSSTNKKAERICWNFGDGTDTCIMLTFVNTIPYFNIIRHTYPAPGVYRVCVKVLFAGGCIASECKEIVIRSYANICGGFMSDSLITQRTYKFHGQSINNTNDAVVEYRWSFGDGSTASGQNVTHTYAQIGNYEVCLAIKTQHGCETHICKKLIVPGNEQSTVLQLSPNPVINNLHVVFYSNRNETVSIRIINTNGTIIRNYTLNVIAGSNVWDFDVSGLSSGIYSLIIQSPNQQASGIFFKQ